MMTYAPAEDLVAIAEAPPTIDETMEVAYHVAAIYFPFDDVIVSDPYKDLAGNLRLAFYVGQSNVIGGTTTDIVAYYTGGGVRGDSDRRRGQTAVHASGHLCG
jgi:hypothetical protein